MIRARLISLHSRRGELVTRAADERERVASVLDMTDVAGVWIDAAARVGAEARRHPLLLAVVAAFLVAWRPRRTLAWLMQGWSLYQIYKRGLSLWQRVASRAAVVRR